MQHGKIHISVVIPTRNGGHLFERLLAALRAQQIPADEIVVIDTASRDASVQVARQHDCRVHSITPEQFNHGSTRNLGARSCGGDILVFMTQDAVPKQSDFLSRLIEPIASGTAAACYARQVPHEDAPAIEVYARTTNYPENGHVRDLAQAKSMGLRGCFFSNVASAISRQVFEQVGGFPDHVIMNEDMVLCARVLQAGHRICYAADAQVLHSHDYTLLQQFRRYFDIGVFTVQQGHLLPSTNAGASGRSYARGLLSWLWARGLKRQIPYAILDLSAKWIGYHLGRCHRAFSLRLKRKLSMHRAYWS